MHKTLVSTAARLFGDDPIATDGNWQCLRSSSTGAYRTGGSCSQLFRVHRRRLHQDGIEGGERDAIGGASNVIRELKPRLAISAYNKPDAVILRLAGESPIELSATGGARLRGTILEWQEIIRFPMDGFEGE